jgi:hypothetical protein
MSRGTQLRELVEMLREEVGRSPDVSVGNDDVPALKRKLRRWQKSLYNAWDWPFRTVQPYIQLSKGEQWYDFPDELDYDRIEQVVVWWNNIPMPLTRGISFREYTVFNSERDVRVDPVRKWDIKVPDLGFDQATGHTLSQREMMEVWPIPASSEQRIQFRGIRKLPPLISDDDRALLDADLIVLYAAAEILARQDDKDAPNVQAAAQSYFDDLKANSKSDQVTYTMGRGQYGASGGRSDIIDRAIVFVSGAGGQPSGNGNGG